MAATNLKSMNVEALLSLRADIDKRLGQKRSELEEQLSRLGSESSGNGRAVRAWGSGRRSSMKGRKVAPKFRGPTVKPGQAAARGSVARRPPPARPSSRNSRSISRRLPERYRWRRNPAARRSNLSVSGGIRREMGRRVAAARRLIPSGRQFSLAPIADALSQTDVSHCCRAFAASQKCADRSVRRRSVGLLTRPYATAKVVGAAGIEPATSPV